MPTKNSSSVSPSPNTGKVIGYIDKGQTAIVYTSTGGTAYVPASSVSTSSSKSKSSSSSGGGVSQQQSFTQYIPTIQEYISQKELQANMSFGPQLRQQVINEYYSKYASSQAPLSVPQIKVSRGGGASSQQQLMTPIPQADLQRATSSQQQLMTPIPQADLQRATKNRQQLITSAKSQADLIRLQQEGLISDIEKERKKLEQEKQQSIAPEFLGLPTYSLLRERELAGSKFEKGVRGYLSVFFESPEQRQYKIESLKAEKEYISRLIAQEQLKRLIKEQEELSKVQNISKKQAELEYKEFIEPRATKFQTSVETFEKDIKNFESLYSGKELSENEYRQALKEQSLLIQKQSKLEKEQEFLLKESGRYETLFKKLNEINQRSFENYIKKASELGFEREPLSRASGETFFVDIKSPIFPKEPRNSLLLPFKIVGNVVKGIGETLIDIETSGRFIGRRIGETFKIGKPLTLEESQLEKIAGKETALSLIFLGGYKGAQITLKKSLPLIFKNLAKPSAFETTEEALKYERRLEKATSRAIQFGFTAGTFGVVTAVTKSPIKGTISAGETFLSFKVIDAVFKGLGTTSRFFREKKFYGEEPSIKFIGEKAPSKFIIEQQQIRKNVIDITGRKGVIQLRYLQEQPISRAERLWRSVLGYEPIKFKSITKQQTLQGFSGQIKIIKPEDISFISGLIKGHSGFKEVVFPLEGIKIYLKGEPPITRIISKQEKLIIQSLLKKGEPLYYGEGNIYGVFGRGKKIKPFGLEISGLAQQFKFEPKIKFVNYGDILYKSLGKGVRGFSFGRFEHIGGGERRFSEGFTFGEQRGLMKILQRQQEISLKNLKGEIIKITIPRKQVDIYTTRFFDVKIIKKRPKLISEIKIKKRLTSFQLEGKKPLKLDILSIVKKTKQPFQFEYKEFDKINLKQKQVEISKGIQQEFSKQIAQNIVKNLQKQTLSSIKEQAKIKERILPREFTTNLFFISFKNGQEGLMRNKLYFKNLKPENYPFLTPQLIKRIPSLSFIQKPLKKTTITTSNFRKSLTRQNQFIEQSIKQQQKLQQTSLIQQVQRQQFKIPPILSLKPQIPLPFSLFKPQMPSQIFPPLRLPKFPKEGGITRYIERGFSNKTLKEFAPSVIAVELQIKGKQRTKGLFTGFELRKIPLIKKRRFYKYGL